MIALAYSPDSDDALFAEKIDWRGRQFQEILHDIQTLNERFLREVASFGLIPAVPDMAFV